MSREVVKKRNDEHRDVSMCVGRGGRQEASEAKRGVPATGGTHIETHMRDTAVII